MQRSQITSYNIIKIKAIVGSVSIAFGVISVAFFIASLFHTESLILFGKVIASDVPGDYGEYVGGFVGTVLTVESLLLVAYTILGQTCETAKTAIVNQFFKMLDYHQNNLQSISVKPLTEKNPLNSTPPAVHRMAFVTLKIQFHYLLQEVSKINEDKKLKLTHEQLADISIVVFYYGMGDGWEQFILDKLSVYGEASNIMVESLRIALANNPHGQLSRTNQTYLSSYFRNMYNAIRLIDESIYLKDYEKLHYVKILRAQLSNPELYVLFFNLLSRFGKKWKEKKYIEKYSFLTNLPLKYTDNYNPKTYFRIEYEEDEI